MIIVKVLRQVKLELGNVKFMFYTIFIPPIPVQPHVITQQLHYASPLSKQNRKFILLSPVSVLAYYVLG